MKKYKITKPIRLIELFAGIGAQAKALYNLGVNFTHYKVVEIDKYAIASYNAIHNTNFTTSDIKKITGKDLNIDRTDLFDYILTYSFPCQDLSLAGKQGGMEKGSNTRSGLLWEVERLLEECEELPQILLMENVPQVIGRKNFNDFRKWQIKLEQLGYSNYFELLNAKDYEIPQNRNRFFMISILGDYKYEFPSKKQLKLRLKDMLEDEVDEKYYLSDKMVSFFQQNSKANEEKGNGFRFKPFVSTDVIAKSITTLACNRMDDNFIEDVDHKTNKIIQIGKLNIKGNENIKKIYSTKGLSPTIDTMQGGNRQPKVAVEPICLNSKVNGKQPSLQDRIYDSEGISTAITTSFMPSIAEPVIAPIVMENHGTVTAIEEEKNNIKNINNENEVFSTLGTNCGSSTSSGGGVVVKNDLRIRKLTPLECYRLMGFSDNDYFRASKVCSNTQLYKQAGNSIVVNVLEAIFKELL